MSKSPFDGKIIDCHNHADWHGHDINRILANMDDHGIARTWMLSWEAPDNEYHPHYDCLTPGRPLGLAADRGPIPFCRGLSYVEKHPDRFVLGYAPDPRRPDAIDALRAAVTIYGVKVCGEVKLRMMYDNPDALRMWRVCGELKLPVTVHIDYEFDAETRYPRPNYWYGGGIAAFERAVAACPETSFLGHAPGFWAHISGDDQYDKVPYPDGPVTPGGKLPELLRAYPNLYCDISAGSGRKALSRDREFGRDFILEFQDRILFGRDYFDNGHKEFLLSLELPMDVLAKIFHGNAERLLA